MKITLGNKFVLVFVAMGLLTGFGLGDVSKTLSGGGNDCSASKDKKKCEDNAKRQEAAKIIAKGAAAMMVTDMVIQYRSIQTSSEEKVKKEYMLTHKALPKEPQVVKYTSSIKPGQIVKAGKEVLVDSELVVIPGTKTEATEIQEQITIYDNENNDKSLISLTKPVNKKTRKSGAFKNDFKFTLPIGMPQGVYPIKTLVLLNGKSVNPVSNKMQLVLNVDQNQQYRIVATNP